MGKADNDCNRSASVPVCLFFLVFGGFLFSAELCAPLQTEKHPQDSVRFEEVASGSTAKKGARLVSFTNYRATDGVFLQRRIETYGSPARAKEEIQRIVKRARRVLERAGDTQSGEDRVVILFGERGKDSLQAAIIWTKGPLVYILESSSLTHLLAFERHVYPRGSR